MKGNSKKSYKQKYSYKQNKANKNYGKNFHTKWQHDKFHEDREQTDSFISKRNNGGKHKTFYVGKMEDRVIILEVNGLIIHVNENKNIVETQYKIEEALEKVGLRRDSRDFLLVKIRIYFEMRKHEFKNFNQDIYDGILDRYDRLWGEGGNS